MRESIGYDRAREMVSEAKQDGKVIGMSNVGAAPYFMHTPYQNHRGVQIGMWSCISMYFERRPGKTLLDYPHVVTPWNEDSWEVNTITDEWLINQVARHHESKVNVHEVDDTPFGEFVRWQES